MSDITFKELLARPRNDRLLLQFSTVADDWRWDWLPKFCKKSPFGLLLNRNWSSNLIRRACHSPFSHVDMVLKDGTLLGASYSPNAPVLHGNPKGVAVRPFDYERFAYRRQAVLETERADDVRRIAITQLGKVYDGGAVRTFISDGFPGQRDWRLTDMWFCSELVTWAMETGGFWGPKRMHWPKDRVSPTDLLLMFVNDPRWLNEDTFWDPIPGLVLGPGET